MLQVIDYSERAVAVIGTTREDKATIADMKAMKGKYNRGLTCGAGWVFSKAKSGEQVTAYVAKWNAAHQEPAKPTNAVTLYRNGDFYEAYDDDAKVVADVLAIVLTKHDNRYMAGFPHHALDTYLPKLVRAGKRVNICDAVGTPIEKVKPAQPQTPAPSAPSPEPTPQATAPAPIINIEEDELEGAPF